MLRTMLKSKIHRATVTGSNVDYQGSLGISLDLMEMADIHEYEQIHVANLTNGSRLMTYAIVATPGQICANGAAAHLMKVGDLIIIMSFATITDYMSPKMVFVNENNISTPKFRFPLP